MKTQTAIVAIALSVGCGGQPSRTRPQLAVAEAAAGPSQAVAPAPASKRDAAVAEVGRLRRLADQEVLLKPWTGPYDGVPPWDKVEVAQFSKAFELGMQLTLAEVDVIAENPEAPTFGNTIVPLQDSGRYLQRAETVFSTLVANLSTPLDETIRRDHGVILMSGRDGLIITPPLVITEAEVSEIVAAIDAACRPLSAR